jgi:hypothetical protein
MSCLLKEQEIAVGPRVTAAVAAFQTRPLLLLALKPWVKFKYFPRGTVFHFHDFSDVNERIHYAKKSYELAEDAGWDAVLQSMSEY